MINYQSISGRGFYSIFGILLFVLVFSIQTSYSQSKIIEGDTNYWFASHDKFNQLTGLKNFEESNDEFNFRFRNHGQVIEISKAGSFISGTLTNYVFRNKDNNSNEETLFKKIPLLQQEASAIYNFVQKSEILNLPSDNKIEKWSHGMDGITYFIEHADKKEYWFKNYWTPSSQDSIPESLIVLSLIKNLSEMLKLEERYIVFTSDLPKKGCYNSGGISMFCYQPNSLSIGYSGATKLPLGLYTNFGTSCIGNSNVNLGLTLQYNFDTKGFYHLNLGANTNNLVIKNSSFSDFMAYFYQKRNLDLGVKNNKFTNHQIMYGLHFKHDFGIGVGFDYINSIEREVGSYIFLKKSIRNSNIDFLINTSIFENHKNYKIDILKSFNLNQYLSIKWISVGIAYEKFMRYRDLYFKGYLTF